jgi:hypothetical protein
MVGQVDEAVRDWAASGLAALTGSPDGPPDVSRAAVLAEARSVTDRLCTLTGVSVDAAQLLAGRAGLLGLTRRGQISAGAATRLLPGRGGWFALTLSRPDDIDAVPALIEDDALDPWGAIERWAAALDVAAIAHRARLLGLPVGVLGETPAAAPVRRHVGKSTAFTGYSGLLVADLSSMWAGPLCGQLLARAGATVVKVESASRPDGTRQGDQRFFNWMNSGKYCYSADFDNPTELRELLAAADVVIESSRPGALRQRGLGPDDVPGRDGRVWLRVMAHGGAGERANWVGFGDDAAVAGGLVGWEQTGQPVFCADAIADPLTGLHAAVAVAESLQRGGAEVVEVSMAATAAAYAALPVVDQVDRAAIDFLQPVPPLPSPPAHGLGGDNLAVSLLIRERSCTPC